MQTSSIRTPSLGDSSFLVTHQGYGLVIDPQRDLDRILDAIERTEVTVTHVLDTHVHNDYLTGAPSLASRLDADLVLPAASGVEYRFVPAFHLEEFSGAEGITIRPIHTPGHTLEHTSYLILVAGLPQAVFTGGSLLVGSAGRTDLLGPALASQLARLQYQSVTRLGELPETVKLYPTHGAGSFCTSGTSSEQHSTIGQERASNPVLHYRHGAAFVEGQLAGLLPYPDYYRHMAPLNRHGPAAFELTSPQSLPAEAVAQAVEGVSVIDGRDRHLYARGHLWGSLNIELSDSFAPWVGWLAPFATPVLLVLDPKQDAEFAATELGRIGYEIAAIVRDLSAMELVTTATAGPVELAAAVGTTSVIDVRDPAEHASSVVPGITHCYLPDLRQGLPVEADEVWLACGSGFRASVAAGLVERQGARPVVVTSGGIPELLRLRPELLD